MLLFCSTFCLELATFAPFKLPQTEIKYANESGGDGGPTQVQNTWVGTNGIKQREKSYGFVL